MAQCHVLLAPGPGPERLTPCLRGTLRQRISSCQLRCCLIFLVVSLHSRDRLVCGPAQEPRVPARGPIFRGASRGRRGRVPGGLTQHGLGLKNANLLGPSPPIPQPLPESLASLPVRSQSCATRTACTRPCGRRWGRTSRVREALAMSPVSSCAAEQEAHAAIRQQPGKLPSKVASRSCGGGGRCAAYHE